MTQLNEMMSQRRTQSERRDESEQRLLTAAAELIATEGYAAASLERVGQMAGYSRGLASQKFGSKDGLVRAVVKFLAGRIDVAMQCQMPAAASALQEVLVYAELILTQIETDRLFRAFWVMMAAAIANRLPIQDAFLAEHENVRRELGALILKGQKTGEINRELDPDAAAVSAGSMMLGICIELLLDPALDIAKVRRAALATIARMLAPIS